MTTVEKIRSILKERKIPVSRLEKELGFSNGYIGQLRKGSMPADRLAKVAAYFNVPVETLLSDEAQKEKPAPDGSELQKSKLDQLNAENRALVEAMIDKLLSSQSNQE